MLSVFTHTHFTVCHIKLFLCDKDFTLIRKLPELLRNEVDFFYVLCEQRRNFNEIITKRKSTLVWNYLLLCVYALGELVYYFMTMSGRIIILRFET